MEDATINPFAGSLARASGSSLLTAWYSAGFLVRWCVCPVLALAWRVGCAVAVIGQCFPSDGLSGRGWKASFPLVLRRVWKSWVSCSMNWCMQRLGAEFKHGRGFRKRRGGSVDWPSTATMIGERCGPVLECFVAVWPLSACGYPVASDTAGWQSLAALRVSVFSRSRCGWQVTSSRLVVCAVAGTSLAESEGRR